MVVKSAILAPVPSTRSLARPSTESMSRSKIGIDCFCVPLKVTIGLVS